MWGVECRGGGGGGLSRKRCLPEVGGSSHRRPYIGCCEDFGFFSELGSPGGFGQKKKHDLPHVVTGSLWLINGGSKGRNRETS